MFLGYYVVRLIKTCVIEQYAVINKMWDISSYLKYDFKKKTVATKRSNVSLYFHVYSPVTDTTDRINPLCKKRPDCLI